MQGGSEVRHSPSGFPLPSTGRGIEGEGWSRRKTVEETCTSTIQTPWAIPTPHPGPLPGEGRGSRTARRAFLCPRAAYNRRRDGSPSTVGPARARAMKDAPGQPSEAELRKQRGQISRGLRRLNTAAIAVLLIVLTLAIAAVVESRRSERQRVRAELAETEAQQKLYETHLARARAERLTATMGRQTRSLEAIAAAVALRADLAEVDPLPLRNEAIASLALADVALQEPIRTLPPGHTAYDFAPSLQHYAVGHSNGTVTLHRFADGELLQSLRWTNAASVVDLLFSPNGQTLAVRYREGGVVLFDTGSNRPPARLASLPVRATRYPLHFSADGRWLSLLAANGKAQIFDGQNPGPPVLQFDLVFAVAFHPGTNWMALSVPTKISFVNFAGKEVLPGITNFPQSDELAFRPDGQQLATASSSSGLVLWDLRTREPLRIRAPLGGLYTVAYDPSGEMLTAAMGDGVSSIWSTRTGELLHRLEGGRIFRFATEGGRFAFERAREGFTAGQVVPSPALRSFQFQNGDEYFPRLWSVEFSDDNRWLAAVDTGNLLVWDIASGKIAARIESRPRRLTMAWLPKERAWLTANSTRGSIHPVLDEHSKLGPARNFQLSSTANSLGQGTLSPDGHTVGLVVGSRVAWLFDVNSPTQRVHLKFDGAGALGHLAFSADGRRVASSATTGAAILVWDTQTGELLRKIPGLHGRVVFSPDGRQLVLGTALEYSFWDTTTWQMDATRSIPRDNLAETTGALTFSPDGKMLAIARTRQLVQLIDPASGHELASLTAPKPQTVSWLRFNPRGDQLAVATFDGAVQLWDLGWLSERLRKWGLDWSQVSPTPRAAPPGLQRSTSWLLLPVISVALVLAFVVFVFHRQRQLFGAYVQVEHLAAQRAGELHAAQTEIVHAQKMKALGTLAAGIAHDFNNLLSIIRMSNQLTGEETRGNPSVQENVGEIEQAVGQGKRVVRSMLGYSRESVGPDGAVALPELVEDTVALLTKQFLNGIALTLELDRDLPPVSVSRNRLEQIVLNLIVNASEAMKGNGALKISVRRGQSGGGLPILRPRASAQCVELVVTDSGPGIDPAILPHIFEPFFTTKDRGATRGTGLGLSTIYTMAEQDGFGITVQSEPGQGAEFHILVPVEAA